MKLKKFTLFWIFLKKQRSAALPEAADLFGGGPVIWFGKAVCGRLSVYYCFGVGILSQHFAKNKKFYCDILAIVLQ